MSACNCIGPPGNCPCCRVRQMWHIPTMNYAPTMPMADYNPTHWEQSVRDGMREYHVTVRIREVKRANPE